jgi:hypothetical protein
MTLLNVQMKKGKKIKERREAIQLAGIFIFYFEICPG